MTTVQQRGQQAVLDERLASAERLLADRKDREGMHWLWAAASGLEGDHDQTTAVLAVARKARGTSRIRVVRSDCDALIVRLEMRLSKDGAPEHANPGVERSATLGSEPPAAPSVAQAGAYYLDDRLSLFEGTRIYPTSGRGSKAPEEGFFVVAIRRRGFRECLFRFSDRDRAGASLILASLNGRAVSAPRG